MPGGDTADVSIALRMALMLGGVECPRPPGIYDFATQGKHSDFRFVRIRYSERVLHMAPIGPAPVRAPIGGTNWIR